jgi:transposase
MMRVTKRVPEQRNQHRMQLKTILNRIEKYKSFVYSKVEWQGDGDNAALVVHIEPRANGQPVCSGCEQRRPGYDRSEQPRLFEFIPLWGIAVLFSYVMRRVDCPECGVVVEKVPWAQGKQRLTRSYAWFLARWAKRLSWQTVAEVFSTNWATVYRAVQTAVDWGLQHRDLSTVTAIGVDEVLFHRGHKYLTVVYQINAGCKRLLWVGQHRTAKTLLRFFRWLGPETTAQLRFVCSDMWKPYLKVIAYKAGHVLHVLDRYHIVANINKAIDEVRAKEAKRLAADGYEPVLKRSRWPLLKRKENLTEKQNLKLRDLLRYNLQTVRAYLLKGDFERFWKYVSPAWAGRFLDLWCTKAMRSRIEPIKKIARSLRAHRPLLLNWFKARGEISLGAVEGLNNKEKVVMRKSYGFRTFKVAETALYHQMGGLPEPPATHRFC